MLWSQLPRPRFLWLQLGGGESGGARGGAWSGDRQHTVTPPHTVLIDGQASITGGIVGASGRSLAAGMTESTGAISAGVGKLETPSPAGDPDGISAQPLATPSPADDRSPSAGDLSAQPLATPSPAGDRSPSAGDLSDVVAFGVSSVELPKVGEVRGEKPKGREEKVREEKVGEVRDEGDVKGETESHSQSDMSGMLRGTRGAGTRGTRAREREPHQN